MKRPKLSFYNTFTILEDVAFRSKAEETKGRLMSGIFEDS